MPDTAPPSEPVPYSDGLGYARSAATLLLIAAVVAAVPFAISLADARSHPPDLFGITVVLLSGAVFLGCTVAGLGLRQLRTWARVPALVTAVAILPVVPVGTFLGFRVLVYLHSASKAGVFGQAAPQPPQGLGPAPPPSTRPS